MASPILFLALAASIYVTLKALKARRSPLHSLPTIGSDGLLWSYIDGIKHIKNSRLIVQEGYNKYYGKAFKIPLVDKWLVVVSGPQMVEDIRQAGDDYLSFAEAVAEVLQTHFTLGPSIDLDPYHIPIVRGILTRNVGNKIMDVREEVQAALKHEVRIPSGSSDWFPVDLHQLVLRLACRTSNRMFVGEPLCHNPEYVALNIGFTLDVILAANIINLFPNFLKPFAGKWLTKIPKNTAIASKFIKPLIDERRALEKQNGPKWFGQPNDVLMWLLEDAKGDPDRDNLEDLTRRILALNFASIHTTSTAMTAALYQLAAHPEVAEPMREEIMAVIEDEGWTKLALGHMYKLDSFLHEAQRIGGGFTSVIMQRRVLKDFTFSDGTFLPAGSTVGVASFETYHNKDVYPDPEQFKAFRFSDIRADATERMKHQMASPNVDHLAFGHGRHACPGRFFAVTELKIILAQILLTYDIKFENEGVLPKPMWFGTALIPNTEAKVLFRARKQ